MSAMKIAQLVELLEIAMKTAPLVARLIDESYEKEELSMEDRNQLIERIRAAKLPDWNDI